MSEKKEFTCTVFEHIERGTRFYTVYQPENDTEGLKIVKHCYTDEEAQQCCRERDNLNWGYFWNDLFNMMH